MIPPLAEVYLPLLVSTLSILWSTAPVPSFMAAQIEQETCVTLKSQRCWSPKAELKTSRENGIGFGQVTRAYTSSGSIRFDKQQELIAAHKSLKGWTWDTRYDPQYQMKALVELDRSLFKDVSCADSNTDRIKFALSGYNGGEKGVKQDQALCRNTPGCLPCVWDGNVETRSLKSKQKWKGYGQSAYDINREYVKNVWSVRRAKYEPYFL